MSHLTLFHGPETTPEPHILSFRKHAPAARRQETSVTLRIRQQRENEVCPICDRVTVEPVVSEKARGRNGAILPMTGQLTGFSCNACGHEWSV